MASLDMDRMLPRRRIKGSLVVGAVILLGFIVIAAFPQMVTTYDPVAFDYNALLKPPGPDHLFGTDNFGRDVFSRVVWGARVDLEIALGATLIPVLLGTAIGAVVGYYGGWLDLIFGRIVDVVVAFPFLVLVIAIIAVLGPGLVNMYIAISAVGWVSYARLVRSEVLIQKQMEYAAAGRVLGFRARRIIFRHIVPNTLTAVVVFWMTDMALVILLGSSLGYLGLGAQPPTAEWGVLVAEGKNFMTTAWWIATFPGLAIILLGIGFSLFGDGLADFIRSRD